jgi:hypothetical protein
MLGWNKGGLEQVYPRGNKAESSQSEKVFYKCMHIGVATFTVNILRVAGKIPIFNTVKMLNPPPCPGGSID